MNIQFTVSPTRRWLRFVLINYIRYCVEKIKKLLWRKIIIVSWHWKKGTGNFNALFGIYLRDATKLTCVSKWWERKCFTDCGSSSSSALLLLLFFFIIFFSVVEFPSKHFERKCAATMDVNSLQRSCEFVGLIYPR